MPVSKVLDLLKTWFPLEDKNLKLLTLKTISLITISSSDRGQYLHLARVDKTRISEDCIEFIIGKKTKTTRKVIKPIFIKCVATNTPELNVLLCIKSYLERTKIHRNSDESKQLFLSYKSFKPVSKQTLARWLTEVLKMSGINTEQFKAHSYRGAGLSEAFAKDASMKQIVEAGNWSLASTFKRFCCAPNSNSEIGSLILQDY